MTLFHATTKAFCPGQEVKAQGDSLYYPDVARVLDAERLSGFPTRDGVVFAAESPVAATLFCVKQGILLSAIRVYEVEMALSHRAPFALIHQIHRRLTSGRSPQALVDEYWAPELSWKFWEFIGPSFVILREMPPATEEQVELFGYQYDFDFDQAVKL